MKLFIFGIIAIGASAWLMSKFQSKDVGPLFFVCYIISGIISFFSFKYIKRKQKNKIIIDYKGIRPFIAFSIDINIFGLLFGLPSIFLYGIYNRLFVYLGAIIGCSYFVFANVFFRSFGFYLVGLQQFRAQKKIILFSNYLYIVILIGIVGLLINEFFFPMTILCVLISLDWFIFIISGRNIIFNLCDISYKKIIRGPCISK